jgi:hypothetical protein
LGFWIFFYFFLESLAVRVSSSMKVERVERVDYPLELSWLWLGSTVMQKTLPAEAESEEGEGVVGGFDACCVIAVVRHC